MAPLLLKHLATSLTRQMALITRLNLTSSSSAASAFRGVCTLAPRVFLLSSARVSSIQATSPGFPDHREPFLLGQCQHLPCIQPSVGMKTKTALKRRCNDCFFVRRRGRLFVFCKTNPRHKQRQG